MFFFAHKKQPFIFPPSLFLRVSRQQREKKSFLFCLPLETSPPLPPPSSLAQPGRKRDGTFSPLPKKQAKKSSSSSSSSSSTHMYTHTHTSTRALRAPVYQDAFPPSSVAVGGTTGRGDGRLEAGTPLSLSLCPPPPTNPVPERLRGKEKGRHRQMDESRTVI